jgi:hypothetical protein
MKTAISMLVLLFITATVLFAQNQQDTPVTDCKKLYDEYSIRDSFDDFRIKPPVIISNTDSLYNNLIYPIEALKNKTEGIVYIKVIIDTSGLPKCPVVLKGLPYGCNEEAIRNVMMIRCIPGIIKKKTADMVIVIPVKFAIKDAH